MTGRDDTAPATASTAPGAAGRPAPAAGVTTAPSTSPRIPRPGRDLELRPFPDIGADSPAAQREALARLRAWAEQSAEDAMDWYLRDKRRKRTASRLLQGLAIGFAVAGTAVPLGTAAAGGGGQGWGYVLLAVAAGCKGFDHFFGVSSTWMRDIGVAHALRGELNAVRLEWATDVLRAGPAGATRDPDLPLEPAEVERQLALIARLVGAVRGHIEAETGDWQAEFSASTRQLHDQGALPAARSTPGG
ncbi:SLATT domain-containing protein [Actinacidiphila acidipaludis]|uniref:SLATT domain-containing protein n=1 Tax=Actinacidiphila acidipaludis TaxID=2873382 RepID=A0ABS7Q3Z3_9ACTN|nr:SLATT domain-containing protein [Streptomyces acidipaludis]MBY8877869.1 SLATT domain-containing protein [Streptomyces acidipaludis]